MLYQIRNATVSLGGKTILNRISFEIRGIERIALVGENGAGKTTLLRMIAGELVPDRDDKVPGVITSARKLSVGMLRQITDPGELAMTVDALLTAAAPAREDEREFYAYQAEYDRIFTGFGLAKEDKKRLLSAFSGGEQTKISLIRLLLEKPDILLLDEPTNHLDMRTSEWLEEYLKGYGKAVVMVSHDRFFLDRTAETVYELSGGTLEKYAGNYSVYRAEKKRRERAGRKAWERQQEEKEHLEELIERFKHKPRKAAFARTRRRILERMEETARPAVKDTAPVIEPIIPENPGSRHVLDAEHAKLGFTVPLYELSLRITRGQKLAVIGENGAGKSTLLSAAAGRIPLLDGSMRLGKQISAGYFDQHTAALPPEPVSVLEYFCRHYPALTEKEARGILAKYLFGGRDASKPLQGLSGGERVRLALAVLLQARPNFLILDEPDNHCDIRTKEVLEEALKAYKGTILFVSHDRYFIQEVADSILLIENGQVFFYPFGYAHYLEQKAKANQPAARMTAENQALIERLHAVPRGSSLQSRQPSEREQAQEWRLNPLCEAMEKAAEETCRLWECLREAEEAYAAEGKNSPEALRERLGAAADEWTKACLAWDDAMLEERLL